MHKKLFTILVSIFFISSSFAQSFKWAKNWGGTGQINVGFSIAVDANGNSYTTGYFRGIADFDPGPGTFTMSASGSSNDDIFISKFDSAGNFIWTKGIGGSALDHAIAIALDSKGNIYTTGTFQGTVDFDPGPGTFTLTSAGGDDNFICKLDSGGNFRWARRIGNANVDNVAALALDPSDNVLITGFFRQIVDFDPGAGTSNLTSAAFNDAYILKLDSGGVFAWAKQIGQFSDDGGTSITSDGSGNVYATGTFGSTVDIDPGAGSYTVTAVGGSDIYVIKLDASGNYVWGGSFGGSNIEAANAIKLDAAGNVYMAGYFWGKGDFDPGTGSDTLYPLGNKDIFVSKLNPSGNLIWAKVMGGTNIDAAQSMAIDGGGNVYTCGFYQGTADFDPGAGTDTHSPVWGADIFISCLDANGNYVSAKVIGSANDDGANSIALDAHNNIYSTGNFGGVADFDPDAGTTNLTSAGANDVFILKLGMAAVGIKENFNRATLVSAYPNPTNGVVTILCNDPSLPYTARLMNTTGECLLEIKNISEKNFTMDIAAEASGVYFLEVVQDGKVMRSKLIKID